MRDIVLSVAKTAETIRKHVKITRHLVTVEKRIVQTQEKFVLLAKNT